MGKLVREVFEDALGNEALMARLAVFERVDEFRINALWFGVLEPKGTGRWRSEVVAPPPGQGEDGGDPG